MRQIAGGAQHVGHTMRDLYNFHTTISANSMIKMDESIIQRHFRLRARGDRNFYYETQDDEEGNILNLFWADDRMREEYKVFGDSISFDTTYRTNKDYIQLGMNLYYLFNVNPIYTDV
ncbi:hypothetical protein LINPERPRIM_LOCUS1323 [Linum perenne]